MRNLIKKPVNVVFLTAFFAMVLFSDLSLGPIEMVSVADAHHKPGHTCNGAACGSPPTVSELPIRYMVPGGLALILVAGGIVYLVRNRSKKPSLKA